VRQEAEQLPGVTPADDVAAADPSFMRMQRQHAEMLARIAAERGRN
jgi:hypothetical protein